MNLSHEELTKKLKSLPQDLQDAFFSDDVSQNIIDIGKTHGLMLDKTGILGDETTLIMLGVVPTSDFIKNLSEKLGVDKEKAKAIAEDINQKVFQQVRASLRKVHGLPEGEKVEVKKPTPQMPAQAAEIPKVPIEPRPGEIKPSSQIFAKKIVPIDELLDKIDSGESIIKLKAKIENVPINLPVETPIKESTVPPITTPPADSGTSERFSQGVRASEPPQRGLSASNAESARSPAIPETNLSPDEIKSAVEKALGGKITTKDTNDPYREPPEY